MFKPSISYLPGGAALVRVPRAWFTTIADDATEAALDDLYSKLSDHSGDIHLLFCDNP